MEHRVSSGAFRCVTPISTLPFPSSPTPFLFAPPSHLSPNFAIRQIPLHALFLLSSAILCLSNDVSQVGDSSLSVEDFGNFTFPPMEYDDEPIPSEDDHYAIDKSLHPVDQFLVLRDMIASRKTRLEALKQSVFAAWEHGDTEQAGAASVRVAELMKSLKTLINTALTLKAQLPRDHQTTGGHLESGHADTPPAVNDDEWEDVDDDVAPEPHRDRADRSAGVDHPIDLPQDEEEDRYLDSADEEKEEEGLPGEPQHVSCVAAFNNCSPTPFTLLGSCLSLTLPLSTSLPRGSRQ